MHYVTAGETHGSSLIAVVDGVPAGLRISAEGIDADLARRSGGHCAGAAALRTDRVSIVSGVRFGRTVGTPVALQVENPDWRAWRASMAAQGDAPSGMSRRSVPCPGRADLAGSLKFDLDDCSDVEERAGARETVARVAASCIAREFLADVGVGVFSYVTRIGEAALAESDPMVDAAEYKPLDIETSEVRCPCGKTTRLMKKAVDDARAKGDTLGGTFRVVATGLLPGVGGYAQPADRLASKLSAALFAIPSVKSVEVGLGADFARLPGSRTFDAVKHTRKQGFTRQTNRAGGLEGGLTTGMPLILTVSVHAPVPPEHAAASVDMETFSQVQPKVTAGDVCLAPSAAVVAEGEVAFVLADAYLRKFGCDTMTDIKASIKAYKQRLRTASR